MKTVKELAAELGVSKSTLHRLIHDNHIETIQQGNKRLIDETIETAIIQALRNKVVHGETICTDAETVQKRVKNDSETIHCDDYETKYIQQLEQQIIDLKADKEDLQQRLNRSEQERQTILGELLRLKQEQPKVIEVKAEQPTVKPQRTVNRSAPKQPPKKQTIMDAVRSFFVHRG